MSGEAVNFFLEMRDQIHLQHWQTHSFSRHMATDKVIKALSELIDEQVETYMGKQGRPRLSPKLQTLHIHNLNESGIQKAIQQQIRFLNGPLVKDLKQGEDSDLFNLRDEILGHLNQLRQLFTLK